MHAVPPFVFIRHGETDWNVEQRLQGQRDVPLNEVGRAQARRNGEMLPQALEQLGLWSSDVDFLSSPLSRARETMTLARAAMGLLAHDYTILPVLTELTFGSYEGLTLAELARIAPEEAARRDSDKWGFVPPGGESYERLSRRIEGFLASLQRPAVIVSHGGVLRVVRGLMEGIDKAEVPVLDIPQDQVFVFDGGIGTYL